MDKKENLINSNLKNLGTESAFLILAKGEELKKHGKDIINLGIGQPDFPTPNHISEAAIKAIKDGKHGYTNARGILELREAVAKHIYNFKNASVDPSNIIIVPGGKITMWHAILMFGGKDKEIIFPNPGFPIYESLINYSGAKPVPYKLSIDNNFEIEIDHLSDLITSKTSLIIFNSPSNPNGSLISKKDMDNIVSILEKNQHVNILSDEIYSRIVYDKKKYTSFLTYPQLRDRVIILDGWSKTYAMTGWRIGYGVWPESLTPIAERMNINSFSCTNTPTQYAAVAALEGPQSCVDIMVDHFNKRRKLIYEKLNEIQGFECNISKGAFYSMPSIKKTGLKSDKVQDLLLYKLGITTVSGKSFGSYGEGYIRLSYANSEENIKKAIKRIKDFSETEGWNNA